MILYSDLKKMLKQIVNCIKGLPNSPFMQDQGPLESVVDPEMPV